MGKEKDPTQVVVCWIVSYHEDVTIVNHTHLASLAFRISIARV